ncbi:MAG: triose-phosphate isomerase [Thermaerobacter sp.]|nr:triose-phosphate isomerase [Thermaerobacter sp.]
MAILAANWKLHKTTAEAVAWARAVKRSPLAHRAEVIVMPGFLQIPAVAAEIAQSPISLGAQDVFWEQSGAYTGMVSAAQITEAGCRYVLVAHSERRRYAAEDDEGAHARIRAALAHGLTPVYCVGEDMDQRNAGGFRRALKEQYDRGFGGLCADEARRVIVAYEPVWAIGSGQPATPEQASEVAAAIREGVGARTGLLEGLRILYGGSVAPDNVGGYLLGGGIDGILVGTASLDPIGFLALLKAVVGNG